MIMMKINLKIKLYWNDELPLNKMIEIRSMTLSTNFLRKMLI